MKKLFTTMLTVLAGGTAFALPVGNPSEASLLCDGICWEGHCGDACDPCLGWADAFSIRLGFYGDYVFQRNLKMKGSGGSSNGYHYINSTRLYTNAGYLAANFWDKVDLFGTLGASNLGLGAESTALSSRTTGDHGDTSIFVNPGLSWSAGIRATLWECGCTAFGGEFQYFQFNSTLDSVVHDNTVFPAVGSNSAKYAEWQFGLGVSHRINFLVPYIAVKWSSARLNFGKYSVDLLTLNSTKTALLWGYAVGVSVIDCEKAAITGEARFGDESAAYINGQFRF